MTMLADEITEKLTKELGRFTALSAMKLALKKERLSAGCLRECNVNQLAGRLEPMLRTLVGAPVAEGIIDDIRSLALRVESH